jgi:hypothetical protein
MCVCAHAHVRIREFICSHLHVGNQQSQVITGQRGLSQKERSGHCRSDPSSWRPTTITVIHCCHLFKRNFGTTDHYHPWSNPLPHVCTIPSASANFKMFLRVSFCDQHRLWLCPITSVVSDWQPVSSVFNRRTEKSCRGRSQKGISGWGTRVILFLGKKFLVRKETWHTVLLWCNRQFVCCQGLEWSLHHLHSHRHENLKFYTTRNVWDP